MSNTLMLDNESMLDMIENMLTMALEEDNLIYIKKSYLLSLRMFDEYTQIEIEDMHNEYKYEYSLIKKNLKNIKEETHKTTFEIIYYY